MSTHASSFLVEAPSSASAFVVEAPAIATAFLTPELATNTLTYSVDLATCGLLTVVYNLIEESSDELILTVSDANTGDLLPVSGGKQGSAWVWTALTVSNQVVLLQVDGLAEGAFSKPALLNCRALSALADEVKLGESVLADELNVYNALAILLFQTGDYVSCQQYLDIIDSLTCH